MRQNGVLFGVQYLRCVAALLVVMHHAWQMIPYVGAKDLGYTFVGGGEGVDVFFVISGFIMVYITTGRDTSWHGFLLDRLARIAPPYWIATLLMAVLLIVLPSGFKSIRFDTTSLFTSLLFIPWRSASGGGIMPLLQVGWTLNFEMFFYVLFTISIATVRSVPLRVAAVSAAMVVLVASAFVLPSSNVFAVFFSSPIMLEFTSGMALALAVPYLPNARIAAIAFLVVAIAIFVWSLGLHRWRLEQDRVLVYGLPSALLVAGVVWCDSVGLVAKSRFLLFLGNSSYALYLLHLMPLGFIRKIWPHVTAHVRLSDAVLMIVSALLCFVVAGVFHVLVEQPLHRLSRRMLAPQRPRGPPVPSPLDLESRPLAATA